MPKTKVSRVKPPTKTYAKTTKRPRKGEWTSPSPPTTPSPSSSPPAKSKTQPKTVSKPTKSNNVEDEDPAPDLITIKTLSKELVLQIIIAKMESAKNCDWFELSKKLGWNVAEGEKKAKGKAKGKSGLALTGNELRDTYYDVILPALKSGRALWTDSPNDSPSPSSTTYPATPKIPGMVCPADEESLDPLALAPSMKSRATKENLKGKYLLDELNMDEEGEMELDEAAIRDLEDEEWAKED